MAGKDLKYFMRSYTPHIVEVPAPESFVDENGKRIMMKIRELPQAEITKIYNNYTRRTIATDKRGNPIVNGNEVVWKTERDSAKAFRHVIAEALVYPDLKDPELMDYYKCADVAEMAPLVFPTQNDYNYVLRMVNAVLGTGDAELDEQQTSADLEDAKN